MSVRRERGYLWLDIVKRALPHVRWSCPNIDDNYDFGDFTLYGAQGSNRFQVNPSTGLLTAYILSTGIKLTIKKINPDNLGKVLQAIQVSLDMIQEAKGD